MHRDLLARRPARTSGHARRCATARPPAGASSITISQPCQVAFATYFSMVSVEFDGVTIHATGGVLGNQGFRVQSGTGTFRNGTIRATLALTDPIGNTSTFRVANSLVQGTPSGARACVGVFNDLFAPLSATCD